METLLLYHYLQNVYYNYIIVHKLCALHLLFIIYFVINKYAFGQTFPFFNHTYDNHILNKKFKSAYTSHPYRLIKQIDKSKSILPGNTIFHPPYEFETILLIERPDTVV